MPKVKPVKQSIMLVLDVKPVKQSIMLVLGVKRAKQSKFFTKFTEGSMSLARKAFLLVEIEYF